MGLIFSVEPSHADAAPMRPLRLRNSSVSIANHIFRAARASCTAFATSSRAAPRAAARAPRPPPPARPPPPTPPPPPPPPGGGRGGSPPPAALATLALALELLG